MSADGANPAYEYSSQREENYRAAEDEPVALVTAVPVDEIEHKARDQRKNRLRQRVGDVEEAHVLGGRGPVGQRVAGQRPVDRIVKTVAKSEEHPKRYHKGHV